MLTRLTCRYSILLLLLLTLAVSGCRESSESYKEMMQAVDSLQVGMSRQEAEAYLEAAVSHWRCAFDDAASEELYLFGSDDVTKADTIWVLYHLESGGAIIAAFANPSRDYLQRAPYNNNSCIALTVTALSNVALPTSTPKPDVGVKGGTPDLHPTATATPAVLVDRLYLSVAELSRDHYLMDVFWDSSGQSLTYAVQGTRSADNITYVEPRNWDWWQFDITTRQSSSLLPPTSPIDNQARHVLGVCANDDADCDGVQRLWESPYGDWVIYDPVGRGEEAWIAGKDGANATPLEEVYLPQSVSWSSDGRWAIVSGYAYRAPGMEVHYLVDIISKSAQMLELLTGHTLTYVNYIRPQFSPDSRYVAYAATADPNHELEESYGLYLLELSNLRAELLTNR